MDENIHIIQSTSRISLFSEINTKHPFFSRETPLQKSELYTNYLLAGVGVVIFMILFMIVIEIRRISKPPKRKPLLLTKNMKIKRVMKPLNDFQMAAVKQFEYSLFKTVKFLLSVYGPCVS